jgi:hypothetical protein
LEYGANVQVREEKYRGTPAGWANYAGHTEVRDLILSGPVDIMEAVEAGLTERVKAILGEDPETLNRSFDHYPLYPLYAQGWYTPLAMAVAQGKAEMVRFLLEHGADPKLRSPEGLNLAEVAGERNHPDIAELLERYG